ncbi:dCTP deaminase [Micromonospora sonchi]|uniref:dCTP deaminase, dUMP-forming n=1 Tax=Micromonospora sonchi TaxID=1763543 RepID=A0A917WT16_9ACTN|nr:dCTP deaminase [Micromonospora sonchi]GGM26825.1 dCTP deaminase [Micromonospora sonchi]
MLLCDEDLARAIGARRLIIEPHEPQLLQPSSIDVRLDRHLLAWPHGGVIDPAADNPMIPIDMADNNGTYPLGSGQMVLASTVERVTLDATLAARVEGKSSVGRLGLATHVTAGFIDPGFSGHITLELVNLAPRPLLLHAGMRIGQLCVFQLSGPSRWPYGSAGLSSHYQGQRGPTASRSHINWRTWPTTTAPTEGAAS